MSKLVDVKNLDDIIKIYLTPYQPKDPKPKNQAQKIALDKKIQKTNDDIKKLISKEKVDQHLQHIVSPEEAQLKITQFLQS